MDIATIFLTVRAAPGGQDWDKGEFVSSDASWITIRGNGYGQQGSLRSYPTNIVERVERKGHWG